MKNFEADVTNFSNLVIIKFLKVPEDMPTHMSSFKLFGFEDLFYITCCWTEEQIKDGKLYCKDLFDKEEARKYAKKFSNFIEYINKKFYEGGTK